MKGTYTALVTPFSEAGIDIKRLVRLIDFQYKNGADGVVLLGTTGEAPTISEREADEIIYEGLKAAEGKIDVVIGCSSNGRSREKMQTCGIARSRKAACADSVLQQNEQRGNETSFSDRGGRSTSKNHYL